MECTVNVTAGRCGFRGLVEVNFKPTEISIHVSDGAGKVDLVLLGQQPSSGFQDIQHRWANVKNADFLFK